METLAEVIAAGRARAALSQEEVGDLIGRTGSAIGKWERGDSVPTLLDLGLLASNLPLERPPEQLRLLRREAIERQRQKATAATPQESGSGLEVEIKRLRVAVQSLGEHLGHLDEVVDFLESKSPG